MQVLLALPRSPAAPPTQRQPSAAGQQQSRASASPCSPQSTASPVRSPQLSSTTASGQTCASTVPLAKAARQPATSSTPRALFRRVWNARRTARGRKSWRESASHVSPQQSTSLLLWTGLLLVSILDCKNLLRPALQTFSIQSTTHQPLLWQKVLADLLRNKSAMCRARWRLLPCSAHQVPGSTHSSASLRGLACLRRFRDRVCLPGQLRHRILRTSQCHLPDQWRVGQHHLWRLHRCATHLGCWEGGGLMGWGGGSSPPPNTPVGAPPPEGGVGVVMGGAAPVTCLTTA